MSKEPKKSDSSTISEDYVDDSEINSPATSPDGVYAASSSLAKHHLPNPLRIFGNEVKATARYSQGYLKINYFTLFWIFIAGSIFGLVLETLYHAIVFGGLESRAGLVWGPFSPIYGFGAIALTVFLNRYYHSHNLVVFLIAMVIGSVIEYGASWGMEIFWGAIAWDYNGTFGSIQGRTNFFFGVMWGMLGLVWVRIIMPILKRAFSHINARNRFVRIVTILLSIFMAINIVFTFLALTRERERVDDIPATNPIQTFCDDVFPDSFLHARFENMTVTGSSG